MNQIIIVFSVLLACLSSLNASSNNDFRFMSKKAQNKYVDDVAKKWRRERWVGGYEDVVSQHSRVTKHLLDAYLKDTSNRTFEQPLYSDEIAQLYRCFHSKNGCQLFQITMSSNYWGGYGSEAMFVLLYTKTKKHHSIEHVVYAE